MPNVATPTVGQIEKKTQARVIALFRERLRYDYLGDLRDQDNRNVKPELLRAWLLKRGITPALADKALRELNRAVNGAGHLYDLNRAVYELLRYGVKVSPGAGEKDETVWLIDWEHPEENNFAVAEEVTVKGADLANAAKAETKRPDVVIHINGIALGVLELKRSTVSVSEGIRQNLDNQKKEFIQPFFTTMQWVMAGNDSEGLRYGTIETSEKYYLAWVEPTGDYASEENLLDRHLLQVCNKTRFLELIHDFVVFDAGIKKLCRQNQYFGVKAAQDYIRRREGGIIWHTQGSGKSLTMVWLAQWIRENRSDARVLIVTDRTELDEQIEKVFGGVNQQIYRTKSGVDLIDTLNATTPWLIGSLVHKFSGRGDESDESAAAGMKGFVDALKQLPAGFKAKGDVYVFVDECHRTQSGELNKAMRAILPDALFIGFTGTPLLHADKQRSKDVFGEFIHTYKFDQAVREGVVLDLRYEAREVDQGITSQEKIDEWFDAKTKGLNDIAKRALKEKWGTMQQVLSSQSRLEKIVADILLDMATRPRLMDGHGNAMLVAQNIFDACRFYELFNTSELKSKCAIVTSYAPSSADVKGETTGAGATDTQIKYEIYRQMLGDWFDEAPQTAINKVEEFEKQVKKKFIDEPGQMKLLIVVDKLLTGFDAPSATYLYIDKQMRDHGLFQAICRVNRLDGDDKQYGYIVDYKDLFKSIERAVGDYTSGAFDAYDKEDVAGLLENRLEKAKEALDDAREQVRTLCEKVEPRTSIGYLHYFCAKDSGNAAQLRENEPKRMSLYKLVAAYQRAFANAASELEEAGYSQKDIADIKWEVDHYTKVRDEVRLASGDYIDLKMYEPAMRHLIDTYIRAEESQKISSFDNQSLVDLIVARGSEAVEQLPDEIKKNEEAVAEAIENNVRKVIINENPVNPEYYERMSKLLDALIAQRRSDAIKYREYLEKIAELAKMVKQPGGDASNYPEAVRSPAQRALYDNLGKDEALALTVDQAVMDSRMDDFRAGGMKLRRVRLAIKAALGDACDEQRLDDVVKLVLNQSEY